MYVFFSMQRHGRLPFMLVLVCVCASAFCARLCVCVCRGEIQARAHGEFSSVANTYAHHNAVAASVALIVVVAVRTNVARFSQFLLLLPSDSCVPRMFPRLRSVLLTTLLLWLLLLLLLFLLLQASPCHTHTHTHTAASWWCAYCLRGNSYCP